MLQAIHLAGVGSSPGATLADDFRLLHHRLPRTFTPYSLNLGRARVGRSGKAEAA